MRIQNDPTESGYNTNGLLEFNTKSGTFTHAIQLGAIPLVNGYRQFTLESPYMVSSRFASLCVVDDRDRIASVYPAC